MTAETECPTGALWAWHTLTDTQFLRPSVLALFTVVGSTGAREAHVQET